ncbi:MAG: hypothetical protein MZW92_00910 [Comamonadaceae bacterium]|nr:hypothetical protein [Comamonadaceae bacterium]
MTIPAPCGGFRGGEAHLHPFAGEERGHELRVAQDILGLRHAVLVAVFTRLGPFAVTMTGVFVFVFGMAVAGVASLTALVSSTAV